jgi:hypothetical protein
MRQYSYVLAEVTGAQGTRWTYKIINDDGVVDIIQDYDPDKPGSVPMSEARAEELAQQQADAMNQLEQQNANQ